ncbi:hypothetical protein [Clostridium sp. ZS2-4]|uniref:hypothetical protein n=1 Tax=Clostridium sp. ZS2-4 TaxID=2987703 RepID=UPI00227CFD03|nr:hypothetical protein [Clostridium sp. ZS2-4]MCY6354426.1 hypothetical protein [Clostridium sp. ZS2-4]
MDQSREKISLFLDALDEKSRKIFWYFRWHRHVRITELTKIINESTDMENLYRLREIINPTAVKIFGRPVLEFSKSRIDPVTGKKVLFNWWLADILEENESLTGAVGKTLVDLFEEDDHITIVSQISPSIKVKDIAKVEYRNGILSVKIDKFR